MPLVENHVIDYGIYPSESTPVYKELLDYAKEGSLDYHYLKL